MIISNDMHLRTGIAAEEIAGVRQAIQHESRHLNHENREALETATEQLVVVNALNFLTTHYPNYVVKLSCYDSNQYNLTVHISADYINSESLDRGMELVDSLGYVPYTMMQRIAGEKLDFVNDQDGRRELVQLLLGPEMGNYYLKYEDMLKLSDKLPEKATKLKRNKI